MKRDDERLVYSTDPREPTRCPRCGQLPAACRCRPEQEAAPGSFTAVLRIEKAGRGGKTVTVIDHLPRNEAFLKDLARTLKTACGAGGTHTVGPGGGRIEIQGDKREQVRSLLSRQGIRHKG